MRLPRASTAGSSAVNAGTAAVAQAYWERLAGEEQKAWQVAPEREGQKPEQERPRQR